MSAQEINPYTKQPYTAAWYAVREKTAALPVFKEVKRLRDSIKSRQVTVIVGETGSGKTTTLPPNLLDLLNGNRLVLTQNRRIAAKSVR